MLSTTLPDPVALTEWEVSSPSVGALPARVPGTAAAAVGDLARDYDAEDWTFRTSFTAEEGHELLRFGGIATVADVLLDGAPVLHSESMFLEHVVEVSPGEHELEIRCHALAPLLAERRTPRARWRTRIADANLRWYRTMLLGRTPGFAPGPAAVGPWRPVTLEPRLAASAPPSTDELRAQGAALWWPHTHGEPVLHEVEEGVRVGVRDLSFEDGVLRVNGVPIFVRGAAWTPLDLVSLAPTRDELRAALLQVRDAGLNMLRVVGLAHYESDDFHDLCDELGILVWQDLMFANFDYPFADDAFRALVEREVRQELARVAWRPSLAVVCGGSEVEQQAAMFGVEPPRGEFLGELVREFGVPFVPNAPSGGDLPFRTDVGVANYFGVGGYRRPLSDARLAAVRFASECLAFANLPDTPPFEPVPQDVGADWDFGDVRDHYAQLLYGRADEDAARAATGEVMAEVFGEWRRAGSPCGGALVLWLRDVVPGAGWGLVDHRGAPKVALQRLRRVLAPVAVWTTDEGLNGIDVHVANDRAAPLRATLRVALYRDFELRVDGAEEEIEIPAHGYLKRNVEGMLGRFVDASYAYRFGPPGHDLVAATLDRLSQAFRFPVGWPPVVDDVGLEASLDGDELVVRTRAFAHVVRVHGCAADDDAFDLEPGGERRIRVSGTPAHVTALNSRREARL